MSDNKKGLGQGAVCVLMLLMFAIGIAIGFSMVRDEQTYALDANAAHYDAKTGELVYGCKEVAGE